MQAFRHKWALFSLAELMNNMEIFDKLVGSKEASLNFDNMHW